MHWFHSRPFAGCLKPYPCVFMFFCCFFDQASDIRGNGGNVLTSMLYYLLKIDVFCKCANEREVPCCSDTHFSNPDPHVVAFSSLDLMRFSAQENVACIQKVKIEFCRSKLMCSRRD